MAAGVAEQHEQPDYAGLSFDERLGLLVDRELTDRASRRITAASKQPGCASPPPSRTSTFATPAAWTAPSMLDLAQAHWAGNRRAIVITGPTRQATDCNISAGRCRARYV